MKKKILSVILSLAVLIGCMGITLSAFAYTQEIFVGTRVTTATSGSEDKSWFIFTPEASGVYSFLSYNTYGSEAYLFIKERDPDTNAKVYKQLDYANTSPDYAQNGQSGVLQFCLTHYLQAGVKYYFAAGWTSETRTEGYMNVMLRCDSYDENIIDSIELSNDATLSAYVDGRWTTDADGKSYYHYDFSKIIANMEVTINYSDGRKSTAYGASQIDGYNIVYRETQSVNHWQPQTSNEYVGNTLTCSVLNASADYDVRIVNTALYLVKGTVTDMNNVPIPNARITNGASVLATTDAQGQYRFTTAAGMYRIVVNGDNFLARTISMTVAAVVNENDFTSTPIAVCASDYVNDSIINAKDYAYAIKNLTGEEAQRAAAEISAVPNFTAQQYPAFSLPASK